MPSNDDTKATLARGSAIMPTPMSVIARERNKSLDGACIEETVCETRLKRWHFHEMQ